MEKAFPWPEFLTEARLRVQQGAVGDLELGKATYQVEIIDEEESFWPFLQFDSQGNLKDSFCSCNGERGCIHQATALLYVLGPSNVLLHTRFENSLFFQLAQIYANRYGFEEVFFEKENNHYSGKNITIETSQDKLDALLFKREKETPENSIKFSNFSEKEVGWWLDGRPSLELSFQLSYWFDWAKWMFLMEIKNPAIVAFQEDVHGYPTHLSLMWEEAVVKIDLSLEDLVKVIPTLESVRCPFKVISKQGRAPANILFDRGRLLIEEAPQCDVRSHLAIHILDDWYYEKDEGFYEQKRESFFNRPYIPHEEVAIALKNHREVIAKFIPVQVEALPIRYHMRFDENWNWHFSAYLFKKGDLQNAFFGKWAYLEGRGFCRVEGALFEKEEAILPPDQVAAFVNHHRIWLNTQEGFQTHLASIESHLTYFVTEQNTLIFQSKSYGAEDSRGAHDFGDWIYYESQGFFSKKHAKLGQVVRPNLQIQGENISSFIKVNREELDAIPHFFTTRLPVKSRGVEVEVRTPTSILIHPTYEGEADTRFFGDFIYIEKEGFCELPAHLRLPELLQKERVIEGKELLSFLQDIYPVYEKYFTKLDKRMKSPHAYDVEISYLVRSLGGLKAELFLTTEEGRINVLEIQQAFDKKYPYLFTEAGLIDLSDQRFQWMKQLKTVDGELVDLSTMDFLKLDATLSLKAPIGLDPQSDISRRLLKELREFVVLEKPNLKFLKSSLRLYQETGLNWLWFLYKNGLSALLCDDMGLGKTHQAMALMAAIMAQPHFKGGRFLVVSPTSVIYHWQDKLERFLPHMKVHTFHGLKRSLKRVPKEGLILTSYGTFRMEKENLKKIQFELAVFDEVQVAKNPNSQIHDALTHVESKMLVGLTGTPIENNLRELKALFDIVLPGYMPKESRFREEFINPIERDLDVEKKAKLSAIIHPFVLRRRKSEVLNELPEKSEDKAYCDLSSKQIALYKKTLAQTSETIISDLRDRNHAVPFVHIFSLLSTLKQICNHPALALKDVKNYKHYDSGKWDLFVELLEEARESRQKVVVFSQYLGMLDIIEAHLQERRWGYAQIRGDTVNRKEELRRFLEDPECVIFIGTLQAAGLGIDLTSAQIVILYDRWWNAARENQAIDRVHRIGQKWGVQVFKLISKGTIEEKIDKMITKKGRLMEEIVTTDDQGILKKFSRSELIDLLSFSAQTHNQRAGIEKLDR